MLKSTTPTVMNKMRQSQTHQSLSSVTTTGVKKNSIPMSKSSYSFSVTAPTYRNSHKNNTKLNDDNKSLLMNALTNEKSNKKSISMTYLKLIKIAYSTPSCTNNGNFFCIYFQST